MPKAPAPADPRSLPAPQRRGPRVPAQPPTVQAWHRLALGPRDTSRTTWGGGGGRGTRQRSPHSDCTLTRPLGLMVPPAASPLSTRGPAVVRFPLRSTPSGVSTQPTLQTGHTGGSVGQHVYSGTPTSGQHDAQPALRASSRATRKDGGSKILKDLTRPAVPTETQNFKRCTLIRRAPGASHTWGAVLDPGTRQSSHWGDGVQTCTEMRPVIGMRGLHAVAGKARKRPHAPSSRNGSQRALRRGSAGSAGLTQARGSPRTRGGGLSPHVPSEAPGHVPSGTDRSVLPVPRRNDRDALPRRPGWAFRPAGSESREG